MRAPSDPAFLFVGYWQVFLHQSALNDHLCTVTWACQGSIIWISAEYITHKGFVHAIKTTGTQTTCKWSNLGSRSRQQCVMFYLETELNYGRFALNLERFGKSLDGLEPLRSIDSCRFSPNYRNVPPAAWISLVCAYIDLEKDTSQPLRSNGIHGLKVYFEQENL